MELRGDPVGRAVVGLRPGLRARIPLGAWMLVSNKEVA
jgi:hypothetical protein